MRALPCRHGAHVRHSDQDHARRSYVERSGAAGRTVRARQQYQPVRSGTGGSEPRHQHAALFPRRISGAHCRQDLSGRRLQNPQTGSRRNAVAACLGGAVVSRVVTLKIDDRDVSGRDDETVLEVARENGLDMRTRCQVDGLSSVGACRLCLVEVKGVPKLLPACTTYVTEGMEVWTSTERINRYRRQIVELLFSEGNHICAVCVSNGHCELQNLAIRL